MGGGAALSGAPADTLAGAIRDPRPARLSWKALAGLALACAAARAVLVLSLADVFFYGEELAKGAAAKAILDGLPVEHWRLAYHYYEGGGFVTSHLNALAFLLLGESLLAQKLVAIAFVVAILLAGVRFCERWFGRAAAFWFAALFTLAPGSIQKLSLLNLGIHFQALLFTIAVLHLALCVVAAERPGARLWFALGAATGFGVYFNYQVAVAAAAAAGTIVALRPRAIATRAALACAPGLALGLAPLAWMFAHAGSAVFDIHGEQLVAGGEESGPAWTELLSACLRSLFGGRDALDLAALAGLPLIALCGLVAAVRAGGAARRAALAVTAFLALFLAAYFASGFAIGEVYHYFRLNRLTPAWLALALLAAAGLGEGTAARAATWRVGAWLGGALLALSGLVDLARAAQGGAGWRPVEHLALLARTKGYGYRDYVGKLVYHLEGTQRDRMDVLLAFDEPAPKLLLPYVGEQVFLESRRPLEDIAAVCRARASERWPDLVLGLGPVVRRRHPGTLAARVAALGAYPESMRAPLAEAIGRFGSGFVASEDRVRAELREVRGAALPEPFWNGLGWRMYEALGERSDQAIAYYAAGPAPLWASPGRAAELAAELPQRERELLLAGYAEALAAHELPRK